MATTKTVSERQISTPLWQRLITSSLLSERAITLSTFIVAAGFMASKVLGLAREVLIARAFGTTAPLDAFRAANTFSDMLDSVIAGVTIAAVFIPVFSTHLVKGEEGRREGWRFASAVLNDMFLLMTVVAGIGILFAPQLVEYIVAPGFD
ncbi:MAG TPA: lipid II flippase MurJ, partial [Anaerolineae bacterium]|nr:lipid II flippase MurJ [Anaerolineae bacterium]